MTEWREVELSEVTLEVADGDWIETKDQGGSDYRLLQVSNIGVGCFRETGKYRYVTEDTFRRLRCTQITPGMVLVARMPDPVGRAWFVDRLDGRAITAVP
jgi:type I restriction enzyme S subunit